MQWSTYQEAIFGFIENSSQNLIIQAVAGSGKTTTLEEVAKRLRSPGLAIAFNKSIQKTLEERFPPSFDTRTFNSLGHRAFSKFLGERLQLEKNKVYDIVRELDVSDEDFMPVVQMIECCKRSGVVPQGARGSTKSFLTDSAEDLDDIRDRFDIDILPPLYRQVRLGLAKSIDLAFDGIIDFVDQIYMPVCWRCAFDRYPVVIVDEAQDLDPLQRDMLHRSLKRNGRIIAAGDRHQAIYAFRGADYTSMDQLKSLFDMVELPLSVSYRCPQRVVEEVQHLVPQIQAREGAPLGTVENIAFDPTEIPADAAIICRNAAPLMSAAWQLIAEGVPCVFLGRELGARLIKIAEKNKAATINLFEANIKKWREVQTAKFPRREGTYEDQAVAILTIAKGCKNSKEVVDRLRQLFGRKVAKVTLCTGHKAKGLEFSVAYFLNEHLIPSKYATTPGQLQQEDNLRYVIATRSLDKLYYVEVE